MTLISGQAPEVSNSNNSGGQSSDLIMEDARSDADRIKEAFDEQGSRAAYKILDEQSKENSSLTKDQQNIWRSEMADKLKEQGILPDLSIVHLEQNATKFKDRNTFFGNSIDVDRVENAALRAAFEGNLLDQALLDSFNSQFEELQEKEGLNDEFHGLSASDLTECVDRKDEVRKENLVIAGQREVDKSWTNELLDEGFFKVLDGYDDEHQLDGHISKGDLVVFLNQVDPSRGHVSYDQDLAGRFTAKQIEAAQQLLASYDRSDSEEQEKGGLWKDGWFGDYVTRESLASGLGYDSAFEMRSDMKNRADRESQSTTTKPEEVETPDTALPEETAEDPSEPPVNSEPAPGAPSEPPANSPIEPSPGASPEPPANSPIEPSPGASPEPPANSPIEPSPGAPSEPPANSPIEPSPGAPSEPLANSPIEPSPGASPEPPANSPIETPAERPSPGESKENEAMKEAMKEAMTVKKGEGYWHIAARLLKLNGKASTNGNTMRLTIALQQANQGKLLHPDNDLFALNDNAQVQQSLSTSR